MERTISSTAISSGPPATLSPSLASKGFAFSQHLGSSRMMQLSRITSTYYNDIRNQVLSLVSHLASASQCDHLLAKSCENGRTNTASPRTFRKASSQYSQIVFSIG